jgi:hypothetical protein
MTLEEAEKIAKIASTADGGCGQCCTSLADQLNEAFPEYEWVWDDENYGPIHVKVAEEEQTCVAPV